MSTINTAIVGAGPYGLSLAAHLHGKDVSFQVLGSPMESWAASMPTKMVLRSEPFASNLWDPERRFSFERYLQQQGLPFQAVGKPVTLQVFLQYAQWFRKNAVGEIRDVRVENLRQADGGFVLELSDGSTLTARNVVLATGHMVHRFVPKELQDLPPSVCVHSAVIQDISPYVGRDVAVIGAGQSALETAALLHEAGSRVTLIARRSRIKWNSGPMKNPTWIDHVREPEAGLGRGWRSLAISEMPFLFRRLFRAEKRHPFVAQSWGPSGAWWLRERYEGIVNTLYDCTVVGASVRAGGGVDLNITQPSGPKTLHLDHIVTATGFAVGVNRINYLDPALNAAIAREGNDLPSLSGRFETSVKGLFVIGVASAPTFGPVMRFMFGAKHAAPSMARTLLGRVRIEDSEPSTQGVRAAG